MKSIDMECFRRKPSMEANSQDQAMAEVSRAAPNVIFTSKLNSDSSPEKLSLSRLKQRSVCVGRKGIRVIRNAVSSTGQTSK